MECRQDKCKTPQSRRFGEPAPLEKREPSPRMYLVRFLTFIITRNIQINLLMIFVHVSKFSHYKDMLTFLHKLFIIKAEVTNMIATGKYSASQIAKYFIWKANKEGKKISNKKLQKLLYYAQAWNLVFNDKPLFKEKIEAWIHGPAIWNVYQEYKKFGFDDINLFVPESEISEIKEKELLNSVWEVYGKYDARYLEELAHSEEPWQKAREGADSGEICRNVISPKLIKEYYTKKLQSAK